MKEIKDDPELAKKTLKFTNERLSSSNIQRNAPILQIRALRTA